MLLIVDTFAVVYELVFVLKSGKKIQIGTLGLFVRMQKEHSYR